MVRFTLRGGPFDGDRVYLQEPPAGDIWVRPGDDDPEVETGPVPSPGPAPVHYRLHPGYPHGVRAYQAAIDVPALVTDDPSSWAPLDETSTASRPAGSEPPALRLLPQGPPLAA